MLQIANSCFSCMCSVARTVSVLTEVSVVRDYSGKTMKLTLNDIPVSIWVTNIRRPFLRRLFVRRRHKAFPKKSVGYPEYCICKGMFTTLDCFILAILLSSKTALFCCFHIFVCFTYF